MPITWRNVQGGNFSSSNALRESGVNAVSRNLDRLSSLSRNIDDRNVKAQRDDLAGRITAAGLDGTVNRDGLDRISDNQFNNLVQTGRTNLQKNFVQEANFDQTVQGINDRPGIDQFSNAIANLQKRSGTSSIVDNINADTTLSDSAKANLIGQANNRGRVVQGQNDADRLRGAEIRNLDQAEASEQAIANQLSNVGPVLTQQSRQDFDTSLVEQLGAFNQETGANVTASINPETGQVEFGNTQGVNQETLGFLAQDINKNTEGLNLQTESNVNTLAEQLRTSTAGIGNDVDEQARLQDQFTRGAASKNALQGDDKTKFNLKSKELDTAYRVQREGLNSIVSNLKKVITSPLKLNTPEGKRQALTSVTDIVTKLSDNFDSTIRPGVFGGTGLIDEINDLMVKPFDVETTKGKTVTINPENLSADMYTTALLALHERGNNVFDEGVDIEAFKKQIAIYSQNQEGFDIEKQALLETATSNLSSFDLLSDRQKADEKAAYETELRQSRDVSKNIRELFKFLPN